MSKKLLPFFLTLVLASSAAAFLLRKFEMEHFVCFETPETALCSCEGKASCDVMSEAEVCKGESFRFEEKTDVGVCMWHGWPPVGTPKSIFDARTPIAADPPDDREDVGDKE